MKKLCSDISDKVKGVCSDVSDNTRGDGMSLEQPKAGSLAGARSSGHTLKNTSQPLRSIT